MLVNREKSIWGRKQPIQRSENDHPPEWTVPGKYLGSLVAKTALSDKEKVAKDKVNDA